ncbi:MAG TPA: biotin/lipoyl-containing protein, partial [Zeimonas sp.]
MAERAIRLPDVGEGVAEAELVEWLVKVGDQVREDQSLAIVMTDKASVEVPSPVSGEVLWLAAQPGENIAVGSDLVRLKVEGEGDAPRAPSHARPAPAEGVRDRAASSAMSAPPATRSDATGSGSPAVEPTVGGS